MSLSIELPHHNFIRVAPVEEIPEPVPSIHDKQNDGLKRWTRFGIYIGIIGLVFGLLFLFYLSQNVTRSELPVLKIEALSVSLMFNADSVPSTTTNFSNTYNNTASRWNISFSITNPKKNKLKLRYEKPIYVLVRENSDSTKYPSGTTLPGFVQDMDTTTFFDALVYSTPISMLGGIRVLDGFEVKFLIRELVYSDSIHDRKVNLDFRCEGIKIGFESMSEISGKMVEGPKECASTKIFGSCNTPYS